MGCLAAGVGCAGDDSQVAASSGSGDGSTSLAGSSESGSGSDGVDSTGDGGPPACADLQGAPRGEVDEDVLVDGVTVTLSEGDTRGEVTMPFRRPVPEVDFMQLTMEMIGAASAVVSSAETGQSASLAVGSVIMTMLANPGEFTWELDDTRCTATFRFVNETPSGLAFAPGKAYEASLALAPNSYVETMPAILVPITVVSE